MADDMAVDEGERIRSEFERKIREMERAIGKRMIFLAESGEEQKPGWNSR